MKTLSKRLLGPKNAWIGKYIYIAIGAIAVALVLGTHLVPMEPTPNQQVEMDISALKSALRMYSIDNGKPPSTAQGLQALVSKPDTKPIPTRWKKMLEKVPLDLWRKPFQYRYPGIHNPDSFDVFSWGPDGIESEDDIGNWR